MAGPLVRVRGLTLEIAGRVAVADLDFDIFPGEALGLVGESGCGKSITALSLIRLLPEGVIRIAAGEIAIAGENVRALDAAGLRRLRGGRVGMIFQEPMTSLNPVFAIGAQIGEALALHGRRADAPARARELLGAVGLPANAAFERRFPHQLSGGQRQRVMIAMAMACEPALLIADEPTTALDVTVQAQILDLIGRLRRERGAAVLLITHDLGVVSEICDRVAVMYAGRIVESAASADLLARPRHRYTRALIATAPAMNPRGRPLPTIAGGAPPQSAWREACAFEPRCAHAIEACGRATPELSGEPRALRCWNPAP